MSNDIDVGAISEALNDKMDRDANNATPPLTGIITALKQAGCSIIIENYTDPNNPTEGYRIWSDGYCEQWGKVTSRDITIPFLKKFKNTNYRIDTQCCTKRTTNPGGDYEFPVTAYNFKTTAFTIWIYNTGFDSNMFVEWKASGYLAKGEY